MCHGGFTHGHHGAGVGKHDEQYECKPPGTPIEPKPQRTDERHGCAIAHQFYAFTRVVAQPPPTIGCNNACDRLNGDEQADGDQAQAQIFQPQW